MDPFSALGFCAAVTSHIRLMTWVLVLPYRNPFLTAHQTASLDTLSGGRLILGVGTGCLRGEFRAIGADFEARRENFEGNRMKLNYQFPTRAVKRWEDWIGNRDLAEIAVAAEECGFDLVSTTDHPFPSQDWLSNGGHHAFEPFVALSFMPAATTRVRLLTFVLVAGYRSPYLAAKSAASLDRLSGGRLVVGMGAGYQRAEFEVLDASFADRGPRFDAAIDAMRAAWSGEVVERDDTFFPAHGHAMLPRPAQRPGPPVLDRR